MNEKAKKIFYSILSLILVVISVLTICFLCVDNFNAWVKAKVYTNTTVSTGKDDEGEDNDGNVVISGSESNGISLVCALIAVSDYEKYGISSLAESAYTIRVTFKPEEPTDKTCNWTIAWANPSSSWASGKKVTDYVTITVSDDTTSAKVVIYQAFGTQILVGVTSKNNSKATATCTLDYVQRVTDVTNLGIYRGFTFSSEDMCIYLTHNPVLSVGTISSDISITVNDISISDAFVDTPYANKTEECSDGQERFDTYNLYDEFITKTNSIPFEYDPIERSISFNGSTFSEAAMGYNNPFFDNCLALCILDGCDNMFDISVTIKASYNGEVYSTITKTFSPSLDKSSFVIVADEHKLSDYSIVI